ncbi:MAG TPA: phosphoribosylamine--glycine ligase [Methanoregulaceae archaeon]|nr:phosphoribosylamine--glycine ligase [Methanoregulaceae archaeon]
MTMKILVVGGGGREHAITRALSCNSKVEIFSVMSKRNPGIARLSKKLLIEKETNVPAVIRFARNCSIDFAIIGPEAPLEAGVVDVLLENGISCVGPSRAAARLETDKAFCREMMQSHGIAGCPKYRVFYNAEDAVAFINENEGDLAIKPIGLTGGKGVKIMGEHLDRSGALEYVKALGGNVVLEERLIGEEFTMQAFVDGTHIIPMPLVQDHKRAYEGDEGPNTGGMGSYSMSDHILPFVSAKDYESAFSIMKDAVSAMAKIGHPYRGILYGQFMNTRKGPMVIEFNARFGDPEAMNVLSMLDSDFTEILLHLIEGDLPSAQVDFMKLATVCKYLVPEGYPEAPVSGQPVEIGDHGAALLYFANIEEKDGQLLTQTSRTLAFVGMGETLADAEAHAQRAAAAVMGRVRYRRDIGTEELLAKRCAHMKELR